ncbi:MAG: hypothetical protein ACLU38_04665 [Dysosmobacter sp.]
MTTVEYASGAYNVTATVTKELKGVKSYTVEAGHRQRRCHR